MYIIIAGGGKVGYYLSKALVNAGHEVLVIEKDSRNAATLSEELGELITQGDACEMRTMKEVGMERADLVVAVTGDDEDNLVICQMAKRKFNVPRTIARVNNPKNEEIFQRLGIDETLSGTRIIFNLIEQRIETSEVIPLAALRRGNVEIVEIDLTEESPVVGRTVGSLEFPPHALVISIIRNDHAIVPHAKTELKVQDSVIALVEASQEAELRKVFSGRGRRSATETA